MSPPVTNPRVKEEEEALPAAVKAYLRKRGRLTAPDPCTLIAETKAGKIIATIICWIFLPAVGIALWSWVSSWNWSASDTTLAAQTPTMSIDLAVAAAAVLSICALFSGWVKNRFHDREMRVVTALLGLVAAGLAAVIALAFQVTANST